MTAAYLVPCLVTLRAEFNSLSPNRDKGADGWIGDTAHASRTSDHNPDSQGRVLALDIDSTGPWPGGVTDFNAFNMMVESLRGDDRLEYIIWNRRIASRDQGWKWRTYTGSSDPHINHAHFSARHDHTGNTSTAPWGIKEEGMSLPKQGDTGEDVKLWQYLLAELGYDPGDADGQYGPKMAAAVNKFRADRGVAASTSVSGWTAFAILKELARKYAGKDGAPGKPGADGRDGTIGGALIVTGGQLTVEAAPTQPPAV